MANGNRHTLYLVPETTFGVTPATPAMKYYRHNSVTLAQAKNTLQSEEIRPDRQIVDFRMGTGQAAGNVVSELAHSSFDQVLEALLMGTWTNNVLKIGITRRSFTMLRNFEDLEGTAPDNKRYQIFRGMEANTLALAISTEAMTQMTVGWIGKATELASAGPVGATYGAADTTLAMDSFTGVIKEGGNVVAVVTEIQLNLENGIEPRYVVGSRDTIRPSSGRATVTGQIVAYFEDSSLLSKYLNEEASSIEFEMLDTANNKIRISLPRIKYTGGQTDVSGQGPITLTLPFQAVYDAASASTLTITRVPAVVVP